MLELFIEGQKVDINEGFSTMLSFAVDDIKDFAAKNSTVSKTVILPGTKNNNYLFGNIFDATISNDYNPATNNIGINFNASVSASIVLFNDNLQIMKGIMQMLEIIVDDGMIEYEVGLFGELAGFAAKLGNLKLEDLDFSAYDHTYSIANIIATWNTAQAGSGYYYPLIDYGTYGRNAALSAAGKHNWKYRTLRPALYAKEYIDKMFADSGYAYDCALFATSRFEGLIVPHNTKTLQRKSVSSLDVSATPDPSSHAYMGGIGDTSPLALDIQPTLGGFTPNGTDTEFTYSGATLTGNFRFELDFDYQNPHTSIIRCYLTKNGGTIIGTIAILSITGFDTIATTVIFSGVTIVNTDVIRVVFQPDDLDAYTFFIEALRTFRMTFGDAGQNYVQVNLGETIQVNDTIPKNILQKDFFSSICKLFNLYVYEDPTRDRVLMIAPFVDFFNLATSINWDLKIDRSQPVRLKPMSELNARYYDFLYKKDSDYWNDLYEKRYNLTYESYKYDSAYEFAKETEKIDLIFSGTPLVGYAGEDKVYSTIFKRTGTDASPVEENTDSNIRLLQAKKITGVASWDILADDGTTVLGSYTDYGYGGHLDDPDAPADDIGFGVPQELFFTLATGALNVNQFNVYWSSYMAEITNKDSKLLSGTFKLDYKDIYGLDFSKLIYLDGSLWRLNRIIDFNATNEDTCKVELLKVINKIY